MPGQPQVLMAMEYEAAVTAVQPGAVSVTGADNQPWVVRVGPRTVVHVTGKAESDMLRPGAHVRLTATVDKRQSKVTEKVSQLTLFTPSKDDARMLGVFYPKAEAAAPPAGGQAAPAEPAEPPKPGSFFDDPPPDAPKTPPKRGPRKDDKPPVENVEQFDIRGQVVSYRANSLTLQAPNNYFKSPIRIELTEDVAISVDFDDVTVAKAGDKLRAVAVQIEPRRLEALDLSIEMQEPLTSNPKKKPARPAPTPSKTPAPRPKPGAAQPKGTEPEPFEVAPPGPKPKAPPAAGPNPPPVNPQPGAQPRPGGRPEPITPEALLRAFAVAEWLELPAHEAAFAQPLQAKLDGGEPQTLVPAKDVEAEQLEKKFGKPDGVSDIHGSLPIGENGKAEEIKWKQWKYGPLRVLVDETGAVRYLAMPGNVKREPHPPEKEEKEPE